MEKLFLFSFPFALMVFITTVCIVGAEKERR